MVRIGYPGLLIELSKKVSLFYMGQSGVSCGAVICSHLLYAHIHIKWYEPHHPNFLSEASLSSSTTSIRQAFNLYNFFTKQPSIHTTTQLILSNESYKIFMTYNQHQSVHVCTIQIGIKFSKQVSIQFFLQC